MDSKSWRKAECVLRTSCECSPIVADRPTNSIANNRADYFADIACRHTRLDRPVLFDRNPAEMKNLIWNIFGRRSICFVYRILIKVMHNVFIAGNGNWLSVVVWGGHIQIRQTSVWRSPRIRVTNTFRWNIGQFHFDVSLYEKKYYSDAILFYYQLPLCANNQNQLTEDSIDLCTQINPSCVLTFIQNFEESRIIKPTVIGYRLANIPIYCRFSSTY